MNIKDALKKIEQLLNDGVETVVIIRNKNGKYVVSIPSKKQSAQFAMPI